MPALGTILSTEIVATGPGASPLWSWNEADLTQFDVATPFVSSGGGSVTPSVVTLSGLPAIQLRYSSLTGIRGFRISEMTFPRRFRLELTMAAQNVAGISAGFFVFGSGAGPNGNCIAYRQNISATSMSATQVAAGVVSGSVTFASANGSTFSPSNAGDSANAGLRKSMVFDAPAAFPASGGPAYSIHTQDVGPGGAAGSAFSCPGATPAGPPLPDALWNNLDVTAQEIGILIFHNAAGAGPFDVWFKSIQVYPHPMDM